MNKDYHLEPPINYREIFYENVIGCIPESIVSNEDYEKYENWFIETVDKLYDMCYKADYHITAFFVIECWKLKLESIEKLKHDT